MDSGRTDKEGQTQRAFATRVSLTRVTRPTGIFDAHTYCLRRPPQVSAGLLDLRQGGRIAPSLISRHEPCGPDTRPVYEKDLRVACLLCGCRTEWL